MLFAAVTTMLLMVAGSCAADETAVPEGFGKADRFFGIMRIYRGILGA